MENREHGHASLNEEQSSDLLLFLLFMAVLLGCLCMGGCAGGDRAVMKGDTVKVGYTCRLPDGKVMVTTRSEVAGNKAALAEYAFLPFKEYGPVEITAGKVLDNGKGDFEPEVINGIARSLEGMKTGETRTVALKAQPVQNMPEGERYLKLSRIRHRKKETTVDLKNVKAHLGHDPQVGEKAFSFEGIDGNIKSIDGDRAVIRLAVRNGDAVSTPFGKGTIRDRGEDAYDIDIDARTGSIVRTQSMVGRVVAVSPDSFTLDYGHPFGGEELMCDVEVESSVDGKSGKGSHP